MQKIFLILIVCIPFLGLRAQEDYDGDGNYEEAETSASPIQAQLDKIVVKLQLTEEQVPQVETLLQEFFQQQQDNPPSSPQEKGERRRQLRASVGKLLTPEQRQQMRQGKGGKKQARRPNASPQRNSDNWLDRLIDDVAAPLLEKRQRNRRGKDGG